MRRNHARGDAAQAYILFYDADCGFCRWAVYRVLRWDRFGRLRARALQDAEAQRWLGWMPEGQRLASWHLVSPEGGVVSGGRAVAPLLRLLPGGRWLAAVAERFPGVVEAAYGWVARNRSWLGRWLRLGSCGPRR